MQLTLGFSPCPNDTFIFDALINKKIEAERLSFEVLLEDVETLNQWSLAGRLDISKVSYGVLPLIVDHYSLLDSGGALGKGVGPLLIAKNKIANSSVKDMTVAIPGENTSAHILFSLAFPEARNKKFMIFSEIEEAVLKNKVDAGVIIHETRFTYMHKGLIKLMDLGEYWENKTGCPIPLGGIVIRKNIDPEIQKEIGNLIKKSIEYAFNNYPFIAPFVKNNSQEMDETIIRQHINLYVNDYSISLGKKGKEAVKTFLEVYAKINPRHPAREISLIC